MSCCTNTYNLGCFNNCSIIAVGLCLTSGTYNGVFTYGNISTTITVTAIENEPFYLTYLYWMKMQRLHSLFMMKTKTKLH